MPIIFQNNPGRVVVMQDAATSANIAVASLDPGPTIEQQRSLITSVTVAQQANFQFLHTIGADIYVYTFGDRVGSLTITGVSFLRTCDDAEDAEHGSSRMLSWYEEHRLSRRPDPLMLQIGGRAPLVCFLTGINMEMAVTASGPAPNLAQFALTLAVVPTLPADQR